MKIRITSVADEEATVAVREPTVAIENALNLFFKDKSYGSVGQFTVVVVAVYSDVQENDAFCKGHNKFGTLNNPFTSEKIKYLSIAIPFDPSLLCTKDSFDIKKDICTATSIRLRNVGMKIPKRFDFEGFVSDMELPLEILMRATT